MKARKPIKSALSKQVEKANAVRKLIVNENARYGRELASLDEQHASARRNKSEGSREVSLIRIKGERVKATARNRERLDALNARLRKILW